MSKCKKLVIGFGLAVVTSFMWLVSSCSQPVTNSVSIEPPNVDNSTLAKSSTTTQPPTVGNSTPVESPTITTEPPTADSSTPAESPTTTSSVLDIDIKSYRLGISGLVNTPLSISYQSILAYPTVTETAEVVCPGIEDETNEWAGVPVSTLLAKAGLMPGASEVVFTGVDGYSVQLPLEFVLQNGVLAYMVDGQTLPKWRGYPLRLVLSGSQGENWVAWVTNIEIKPALSSFINPSAIIQNSRGNVTISGRKLCSCLFLSIRGPSKSVNQS